MTRTTRFSHGSHSRRWRRFISLAVIVIVFTVIVVPAGLGIATTYRLLYSACDADPMTPGDFELPSEDLTLTARVGGQFRAFYIPGTNRAAIIIPPTMNDGRGDRLPLAAMLARHGYAVVTFESRRCAGMGPLSLGYKETDEVGDVLAYLQTRSDVDPNRIGITGFSSAGATAIMSAARFSALRAVIAEGGYGDFAQGVIGPGKGDDTLLETLYKQSLRLSYHLITGIDIDKLSPVNVIGLIAPRPILLIYGSREHSLEGARQQLAAAGENVQLWIVEGARHGTYRDDAYEEYENRVIAFFGHALLSKGITS